MARDTQQPVFTQVMDIVHRQQFLRCVQRHNGNYRSRTFTCRDQFLCMAFAQMTYRESLRDIESCLRARASQLYRMGIHGHVSRTNLADANERRSSAIYADLAASLVSRARKLYAGDALENDLAETVYAFDSTTIDLCLSLFPWAKFRSTKSGIKLHTLLDLRGSIPAFISITGAGVHDVNALDDLRFEPGAFYIVDRGYLDFARLFQIDRHRAFFVIRPKSNTGFVRHSSTPVADQCGVRSDHIGRLRGKTAFLGYPEKLRMVSYFDPESHRVFRFLTNNFVLPAEIIAKLYKMRWQVELFFKWIKGHLRIKTFFGTSANAVETQIWIAICVYALISIVKRELALESSLHRISQVLSVSAFEKVPLHELLTQQAPEELEIGFQNTLPLWDL